MNITKVRTAIVVGALAILAACAKPLPPPPPPPPPPPAAVVIPARPVPPMGAADSMTVPQIGPNGIRQTVNANLSPAQVIWNVRSALNVAALNCLKPAHAAILPNYSAFLATHSRALSATNKELGNEFRTTYGSDYRDVQDRYMTQVYNYFALPPAQSAFCDAALAVSNEAAAAAKGDLDPFSARNLPRLESVFDDFYRAYEQYRVNVAMWDSRYGTPTYATATYGTQPYTPPASTYLSAPYTPVAAPTSTVPTSITSVPVSESTVGPVVQPLPESTSAPTVVDTMNTPAAAPVMGPVVQPLPDSNGSR